MSEKLGGRNESWRWYQGESQYGGRGRACTAGGNTQFFFPYMRSVSRDVFERSILASSRVLRKEVCRFDWLWQRHAHHSEFS